MIMSTHHQCLVSWALLTQYADEKTEAPESISHSPGCRSEVGSEASLPASHIAHGAQGPGGNMNEAARHPPLVLLGPGRLGASPKVTQQGQATQAQCPLLNPRLGWGWGAEEG